MYIDFKITGWERANISEKDKKKILKAIKDKKLNNQEDFFKLKLNVIWDKMNETYNQMTLEESKRLATLEVYNDEHEIIHANGKY